jgi:hypothetical protein
MAPTLLSRALRGRFPGFARQRDARIDAAISFEGASVNTLSGGVLFDLIFECCCQAAGSVLSSLLNTFCASQPSPQVRVSSNSMIVELSFKHVLSLSLPSLWALTFYSQGTQSRHLLDHIYYEKLSSLQKLLIPKQNMQRL